MPTLISMEECLRKGIINEGDWIDPTSCFFSSNKKIILSGGSFHNRYLKERLIDCLSVAGFEVFTHQRIPCNDGGLSYGQLMVAAAKREGITCV